jgi:hypothetical protein
MNESIMKRDGGQLEYALSVENVMTQVRAIQDLMKLAMRKGEHYGVIPGTERTDKDGKDISKPTLLKPGAEKLTMMFRLSPSYAIERRDLPGGHMEVNITCTLTHIPTGAVWGQGVGSCSTMEGKYRFRWENTGELVPAEYWESRDKSLIGGETFVPRKAWKDKKQSWFIFQRVEHDNPADYHNTVLKMGKKRSLTDATLTATAASDIFTQDIEDMVENEQAVTGRERRPEQPKEFHQGDSEETAADSAIAKLKDALKGDTDELAELTKFWSKRDNKEIPGCRDFSKLSETRARIALETWTQKHQGEEPQREPGQDDEEQPMLSTEQMKERLAKNRRSL